MKLFLKKDAANFEGFFCFVPIQKVRTLISNINKAQSIPLDQIPILEKYLDDGKQIRKWYYYKFRYLWQNVC